MKILYALHPKSKPSTWQSSGDTNMAIRMLKHLPEEFEVDVFSDFSGYDKDNIGELLQLFDENNISGSVNSAPHIQKRTFLKESMKFLRSIASEYDLIHFHNSNVASVHWMTEYFNDCPTPIIYTMHTPPENSSFQFYHKDEYLSFGSNPKNRLVAVSESHYLRVLQALQVTSGSMPSLRHIANGIEPLQLSGEIIQDIDVSVVGRLDPTKDILHSLKAARACSPSGKVVYVGQSTATSVKNEDYEYEVERFIEENDIIWHKRLPNVEVQNILARSKAHIALSRIETYGLTVVEAQMHGTPVIGFDAGGIGENIQEGVSGGYVQAKGAWKTRYGKIADIYKEVITYNRDEIKNRAQQLFDISKTAKGYISMYRELGGENDGI